MKRFVSAFLLLIGLLVAGGEARATVVLDTGTAASNGIVNINTFNWPGISFTTGPAATTLESIKIALNYNCGGFNPPCQALTIQLSLFADAGGGVPASNAVPLATYTAPAFQPTSYVDGNAGTLTTITLGPTLSSYTLLANTPYVLIFSQPAGNFDLALNFSSTSAAVSSAGWSEIPALPKTSDSGATWSSLSNLNAIFQLSAVPTPAPAAVPSLSEWTQLMLGLMVISMLGWQWRKQKM